MKDGIKINSKRAHKFLIDLEGKCKYKKNVKIKP